MSSRTSLAPPVQRVELEEGLGFMPRFDDAGLIVCVTTDAASGVVLMVAYMNEEALHLTLDTGIAHYWSRSRQMLWRKGDTSGQIQRVEAIYVDCDQDAIWLKVHTEGTGKACHTGRLSCFYRRLVVNDGGVRLVAAEQ